MRASWRVGGRNIKQRRKCICDEVSAAVVMRNRRRSCCEVHEAFIVESQASKTYGRVCRTHALISLNHRDSLEQLFKFPQLFLQAHRPLVHLLHVALQFQLHRSVCSRRFGAKLCCTCDDLTLDQGRQFVTFIAHRTSANFLNVVLQFQLQRRVCSRSFSTKLRCTRSHVSLDQGQKFFAFRHLHRSYKGGGREM